MKDSNVHNDFSSFFERMNKLNNKLDLPYHHLFSYRKRHGNTHARILLIAKELKKGKKVAVVGIKDPFLYKDTLLLFGVKAKVTPIHKENENDIMISIGWMFSLDKSENKES